MKKTFKILIMLWVVWALATGCALTLSHKQSYQIKLEKHEKKKNEQKTDSTRVNEEKNVLRGK